jgi:hypothetical protein
MRSEHKSGGMEVIDPEVTMKGKEINVTEGRIQ